MLEKEESEREVYSWKKSKARDVMEKIFEIYMVEKRLGGGLDQGEIEGEGIKLAEAGERIVSREKLKGRDVIEERLRENSIKGD